MRSWGPYWSSEISHEGIEIVKTLAPLTDNPNAPNNFGITPIYLAALEGHTEIVKIQTILMLQLTMGRPQFQLPKMKKLKDFSNLSTLNRKCKAKFPNSTFFHLCTNFRETQHHDEFISL